jgi:Na+/H+ antiporter NhaC
MTDYGFIALIPTLSVLLLAVITHRTIESLMAGVVVGLLIIDPASVVPALAATALDVLADDTVRWVILVCGLLGSIIAILAKSGAAAVFGETFSTFVDSKRKSMLTTAVLGTAIFIDDYLNALAVSSSMRRITERYRVSREMLAYIVDSTAAPISLIVPISTWAVFFSALIVDNGLASEGEGLQTYISAIPYLFYPWAAMIIVFLVAGGVVPVVGPMKKAEADAEAQLPELPDDELHRESQANLWTFLVPMASLVGFTVYFDIDIFQGAIATLFVTIPLVIFQKAATGHETFDAAMEGFLHMLAPLATVFGGFMLKEVNDELGLTRYVIDAVLPFMTPGLFPVIVFLTMGFLGFATASFWGIFVIAFPIIIPLATAVDANMPLVLGAMLSASGFGSHACFYSDATVLAAKGSGCTPIAHAFTQFPYALMAAGVAAIGFLLAGF